MTREEAKRQLQSLRDHCRTMIRDEYEDGIWALDIAALDLTLAALTPPNEPERAGLYGEYTVYKNKDGSLVPDCFVLRPAKDPAAVAALRAYATATDNAELAADIINWVGAEPNEPLTLEQLREMDGKPVWVEELNLWTLVDIQRGGYLNGVIFVSGIENGTLFSYSVENCMLHCYRRPPEGGKYEVL